MVKLDVSLMRFLEEEDFRCIIALEMAMRNHEIAPTALVERIAQLAHGGTKKRLKNLLKHKLIHHETKAYDGYTMKYGAYDLLAFRTFSKRGTVAGVGTRIGCGKESDIIHVEDENGQEAVCKLQRLGRCSFRTVSRNRDYKNGKTRRGESWFYLSRLAAQKEFAFMKMLHEEGFPVPKPLDHNRHAVVMEYIDGVLLNNIQEMAEAQMVYERCLALMVKLAQHGLIHGDFNEFNILITEDLRVILIDFPQMVSTDHPNAAELFDRDVINMAQFFHRRFRIPTQLFPKLDKDVERVAELDRVAMASGHFSKHQEAELERLLQLQAMEGIESDEEEDEEDDDEDGEHEEYDDGDESRENAKSHSKRNVVRFQKPAANAEVPDGEDSSEDEEDDEESEEDEEAPEKKGKSKVDETAAEPTAPVPPPAPRKIKIVQRTRNGGKIVAVAGGGAEGIVTNIDDGTASMATTTNYSTRVTNSANVDEREVTTKIKRAGIRADDREFNRTLHRNAQKGREKQRIQRQLHSSKEFFFD